MRGELPAAAQRFVTLDRARVLLHPAQATFLDRLLATLDQF